MSNKYTFYLQGFLFLIAIYFPIFLHLNMPSLYLWDEATNALQAYEMSHNGNYLRRFFLDQPDNWETKPPLLTWLQVLCMKILGYNELAVRLPSSLAALGTVYFIISFFKNDLKLISGGIFSCLILLTSTGYVRGHVIRSGDHDALLIMFLTAATLYFFKFIMQKENQNRNLMWFAIFIILGVLTKSIAGLYFAPAFLIFVFIKQKFIQTISSYQFWVSVIAFLIIIGGYYLINEYYYPGYLKFVWNNELFPRFFNTASTYNYNEMPSPIHYLKIIIDEEFKWFCALIPASIIYAFFAGNPLEKEFLKYLILISIVFLIIISNGTFNSWYHAPVFPLLSMIVGIGLGLLFRFIQSKLKSQNNFLKPLFPFLFSFTIFFIPYKSILQEKCYFPKTSKHHPGYGDFLKFLHKEHPEITDFYVYYQPRNRHFLFYKNVFNNYLNYNIKSCGPGKIKNCPIEKQAKEGDLVLVCQKKLKKQLLKANKVVEILRHDKGCTLYSIEESFTDDFTR